MKTENYTHNRKLIISALLAVFFWCIACSFYSTAVSLCSSVGVKWENGGVSPFALVRQQTYAKQDGAAVQPEVTLWQINSEPEVMTEDKKSVAADVVVVFGDCRDITSTITLHGAFPARSDQSGCAVSSGLAFSLWGSTDVCGLSIKMDGDIFYVRGVFEEEEPRLFCQAQDDSKELLSNMQLKFSGTGTREKAENYLVAADFPGGMILELPLIEWVLDIIFRLPAIVLSVGIFVRVIRRGKRLWHYPVLFIFYLPSALALSAGLFFCMDLPGIPAGFIPTMWSDFEFWRDLFVGHWKNLTAWMLAASTFRDMELAFASFMAVLFSMCAAVFAAIAAFLVSIRTFRSMVLGCTAYTLLLCLLSLLMAPNHNMMFCKAMYLMPCLWLCADFMFYRQEKRLTLVPDEREDSDDKSISQQTESHISIGCKEEKVPIFISGEKEKNPG